jgi:predicted kinase
MGAPSKTTLIVISEPPGSGKTTAARRLSSELRLPLLSSDVIGRIARSSGVLSPENGDDAFRIAYEVVSGQRASPRARIVRCPSRVL